MSDILKGQTGASMYDETNAQVFLIKQLISKIETATLVKVISCTNAGGLSPVGLVDVQPLVNQTTIDGLPIDQPVVYNVPYTRIQGGSNAVIIDPVAGDIGICVFASRDITKVKNTKDKANPDTLRTYSMSDGLYIGGVLNGTPTQFVQFSNDGITLTTPSTVTINAASAVINAPLTVNDDITATGTITAPNVVGTINVIMGGIDGKTHTHGGVQTGTGNTGVPQ